MELLSPAGSFDALRAAVAGGCDAVYMGSSEFANARMNASNFSKSELEEAIGYCRLRGVKSYITVNTLLTDRELSRLFDYAVFLYENGADGVIVQDTGAMRFLSKNIPPLALHASTQMALCNLDGVNFAEKLGCTRAVIARELSKENIDYICCNSNIEIEVFVHGAICSCCSGYCLMSSFIGRRSGNRGRCAQPCRLPYSSGGKEGFFMSLKDMMLVNHIDELRKSGVASLKIEGRMKSAGYVGNVTEIYRRAIDGDDITAKDVEKLTSLFNRGGYTDGYYTGAKDLFAVNKPETSYGVKTYDKPEKKFGIKMYANAKVGSPLTVAAEARGIRFEAKGGFVCEKALKREVTAEDIRSKAVMLGDTPFYCEEIEVEADMGLMVPLGEIKAVRRSAAEGLEKLLLGKKEFHGGVKHETKECFVNRGEFAFSASILSVSQYRGVKDADLVYVPLSLIAGNKDSFLPFDDRITVTLPKINHDSSRGKLRKMISDVKGMGYKRFAAANYGDFEECEIADYPLWSFNSEALSEFSDRGAKRVCLSPELNISMIKAIKSPVPCEAVAYGKLPLMTSVNCFSANSGMCGECGLKDRTGKRFETVCDREFGNYEVLNCVPIYMADKKHDFENTCVDTLRLVFTTETESECRRIIEDFRNGREPCGEFTRGHYYRGV